MSETLSNETISPIAAGRTTSPYLFLVFRSDRPFPESSRHGPSRHSLEGVSEVILGRGVPLVVREAGRLLIFVDDQRMSEGHARIRSVDGGWLLEDPNSHNGTFVRGNKQSSVMLADRDWIECGRTYFYFRAALTGVENGAFDAYPSGPTPELRTLSPDFARDLDDFSKAVPTKESVVLIGETGVGKEVAANALHERSRPNGPLISLNCANLIPNLATSQLFGHRAGAFSGAQHDSKGAVRDAEGGTLFLDEIGDLPLAVQAMLLRTLQNGEVTPVGGSRATRVDFRLVVAGQRSLNDLVREGSFRPDLKARINHRTLLIPPVRERLEDLGILIASILRNLPIDERDVSLQDVSFTRAAARALLSYDYPGNVRELQTALRNAIRKASGSRIDAIHLPEEMRSPPAAVRPGNGAAPVEAAPMFLSEQEVELRDMLILLWNKHKGNISAIAREMGKERNQIRRWLKRFRIGPYAPGAGG